MKVEQLLKILKELSPNAEISFGDYTINGHISTCLSKASLLIVKNKRFDTPDCYNCYDIETGRKIR